MQVLTTESATFQPEFGILAGRWNQYATAGDMPFGAMWCVVPPAGRSDTDRHPERELVLVMKGSADVEAGGRVRTAHAGSAVLLDSDEAHVLVNRSRQEPLVLLSMYWMPEQGAGTGEPADGH